MTTQTLTKMAIYQYSYMISLRRYTHTWIVCGFCQSATNIYKSWKCFTLITTISDHLQALLVAVECSPLYVRFVRDLFLSYYDNLTECMCWLYFLCFTLVLIPRLLSLVFQHNLSVCQWDVVCYFSHEMLIHRDSVDLLQLTFLDILCTLDQQFLSCDLSFIFQTFLKSNNCLLSCIY